MKLKSILAVACLIAAPAFADPVYGVWQTIPDDNGNFGNIEVKDCGGTICGTLVKSFAKDGSEAKSEHLGKKSSGI